MERASNIELCRICAMCLVVLVHSQFATFGIPTEFNFDSILRIILQAVSIIGVDVFVIISGYFSIKLTKKSLFNLLYVCLFYGILIFFVRVFLGGGFLLNQYLF